MKLSEIAQYWAAKEFVTFDQLKDSININTPFGTKDFTITLDKKYKDISLQHKGEFNKLVQVSAGEQLTSNSFTVNKGRTTLCFDLQVGYSEIVDA